MFAVVFAAFWYDASVTSAGAAQSSAPQVPGQASVR
jgi:hypothetical protein